MKLTLQIWRENPGEGRWEQHELSDLDPSMSLLDALDQLNEKLTAAGREPVAFESDCREGICGACGITVNGEAHGPEANTPACHQRLRSFTDGQVVKIEPLRAHSYPVLRDLMVDRSGLDRVIVAGGYVSIDAGTAPDAQAQPVTSAQSLEALDFAACIGCGACVSACPNGSAQLFVGAKLAHLSLLPLPGEERTRRAQAMVEAAEADFGPCSNYGLCATVCPAEVPLTAIAAVNHERLRTTFKRRLFPVSFSKR